MPPCWLDKEAVRRGREFFMNNATAISISNMEVTIHTHCKSSGDGLDANIIIVICVMKALLLGLCIPNFYRLLGFSRKSHMSGDAKAR